MDLTTILSWLLTSDNIDGLAKQVGIENKQAQSLIKAGLPILMWSLKKNTETSDGAQSLSDALDQHQELPTKLTDLVSGDKAIDAQKILGHILGQDKDKIQGQVAQQAWVSGDQAGQILWALAQAALGWLGQAKKQEWLDTTWVSQTVSSISDQFKDGSMLDTILVSMFDKNKDGSYKDDLITMGMNWIKSQLSGKKS
jgi:hypothetical protein